MTGRRGLGVNEGAALAYLQREADLDGLVTVSQQEIADVLGVHQTSVSLLLSHLCSDGFIANAGHVNGIKSHAITAYQLSDEAMA